MLEKLNDDCLGYIFKLLNLEEQLHLANSCERFHEIITSIWSRKAKTVTLTRAQDELFKENSEDFLHFMNIICKYVEFLKFEHIDTDQFRLLKNLVFPKVEKFDCNLWNNDDEANDQDVQSIQKMFPAITKLILSSSMTGQYIASLVNLIELDLSCNEDLDVEYFGEIFTTLKLRKFQLLYYGYNTLIDERIRVITQCKTLEEITMDDHHLSMIIEDVCRMPRISKITTYTRDYDEYIMDKVEAIVGMRMHTMIYYDAFWSKDKHLDHLIKMKNLRKLSFYDDDITDDQLKSIALNIENLEEFHFRKGRVVSDFGLLSIAETCKQLLVLDVSQTQVSELFLQNLKSIVEEQKRTKPLEFRCFGIETINSETVKGLPPTLHASFKEYPMVLDTSRMFQCEWQPLEC